MAGKKQKTDNSPKKGTRSVMNNIMAISVVTVIGVIGIYFGVNQYNSTANSEKAKTVELPTINTSISSSSTGEAFYISADVMLLFEDPNTEDRDKLKDIVTEAVSGLDYDGVTGDHNINYIKEHIKSKLSDSIQTNVVANIYITDLQSDRDPIMIDKSQQKKTLPWAQ